MSAAALCRISLLILITSPITLAQESQPAQTQPKTQSTNGTSGASERSEAQQTTQPVTIPNPSLSAMDGAWQLLEAGVKSGKASERAIAFRALGLILDNARAGKLAEAGVDDAKPEVRAAAAEALGKIGWKSSVAKLQKMLDDKDNKVVLSAAQALIELKNNDGYEVYYEILTGERKGGSGLIASQEAMLKDPKRLFALGFHEGLGFVPFGGIGWEAFKTVTKDDVSPLRAAAAKKLAQDPDPASTQALTTAAGDKNWLVRAAALEALALRGDHSAAKTAALYMYDDRPEVKYIAAGAVIRLSAGDSKSEEPKNK